MRLWKTGGRELSREGMKDVGMSSRATSRPGGPSTAHVPLNARLGLSRLGAERRVEQVKGEM